MIRFKKFQNTRKDFGAAFDYFLEKNWARGYFNKDSAVDRCLQITRNFTQQHNRQVNGDVDLKDLFYDPDFVFTSECDALLEIMVDELFFVPTHHINWYKEDNPISDNFIFTEIYESADLPHYYILHTDCPDWPFLLVNKMTGQLIKLYIAELIPSNYIHKINGRFLQGGWTKTEIQSDIYYQFEFPLSQNGDEVLPKNHIAQPIEHMIHIPEEFAKYTYIGFLSPLYPKGTNIEYEAELLTDEKDIRFRDQILDLIKKKESRPNEDDLPF